MGGDLWGPCAICGEYWEDPGVPECWSHLPQARGAVQGPARMGGGRQARLQVRGAGDLHRLLREPAGGADVRRALRPRERGRLVHPHRDGEGMTEAECSKCGKLVVEADENIDAAPCPGCGALIALRQIWPGLLVVVKI